MKIVFVSSEMSPFAKTGGLGDVLGTLPPEIAAMKQDIKVFLPKYKCVNTKKFALREVIDRFVVPLGQNMISGSVWATNIGKIEVFFIDHPEFFNRDGLYGDPEKGDFPDNDRRFTFFQRSVLEVLKAIKFKPDIIHCHDWQTGLIPVYLKTLYEKDPFFKKTKTVFTIHNLAFHGCFPPDSLPLTGLGWEEFTFHRLEFWGKVNFLKGGLVYSDMITTVSKRYGQEIQTSEYGCGLEGVLQERKEVLTGIVNGIDNNEWNPETDMDIYTQYNVQSAEKKKAQNKTALQKAQNNDVDANIPLIGMVSRITDQKGFDLILPILKDIMKLGAQFILLGMGQENYHEELKAIQKKFPKQMKINLKFDGKLAKKIYAASDFFLMPSRFEPCGLGQLISLRYGAVPIVRATGGLADTIEDYNARTGVGKGFCFSKYSSKTLLETIKRGLEVYEDKESWWKLVTSDMKCDFSWKQSAKQYLQIYRSVEKQALKVYD